MTAPLPPSPAAPDPGPAIEPPPASPLPALPPTQTLPRSPEETTVGGVVGEPGPGPDISWGADFKQFSTAHFITVACCAAAITAVVLVGRAHRRRNQLARGVVDGPGQLLGVIGLMHWFYYQLWWNIPPRYGLERLIPLQLCDLAGVVAGLALITGRRFLSTTLYFWAFALSTQAFFTPIVRDGPALTRFWLFWESHTFIVGAAVYIVAVRGYRPYTRDFIIGLGMTILYAAIVFPLNLRLGSNFGYIGRPDPDLPTTLMDKLGLWPWRMIPLFGIVVGAFLIIYLPWLVADRFGARTADAADDLTRRWRKLRLRMRALKDNAARPLSPKPPRSRPPGDSPPGPPTR
jgi:hypothetical integral membrane protein (TIGR02206 family)